MWFSLDGRRDSRYVEELNFLIPSRWFDLL